MTDRPLVCILVDAFRHDYLDERRAPVLARLAHEQGFARMRPILGYSDSIRATIFTGAYPSHHGYWMEYCYRPGEGPFGPLARLAPLDRIPSDFAKRSLKVALSATVVRRLARTNGYRHLSLRHLPFRSLGVFDWTLKDEMTGAGVLGVPTLFDELSAQGVAWQYLDSTRGGRRSLLRSVEELGLGTRFCFVYLHQIDMASHMFGLGSRLFERVLGRTDTLVGEVIDGLRRRLGDAEIVVFSDHGMSPVRTLVSLPDLWRHPGFPDRFCFALDATMVRLWYEDRDPELRDELRGRLLSIPGGRFLEQPELRALHLDFDTRLYGDEIFLLEPGTALFPNFHSLLRPKAMHAYHPDDPDQHGIFVAAGADEREAAELVDVRSLADEALGIAPAQPPALAAAGAR